MTNFLEQAMEQEELRETSGDLVEEAAGAGPFGGQTPEKRFLRKEDPRQSGLSQKRKENGSWNGMEPGGTLFQKSIPPDPPKSIGEGEFRFSPSPNPTLSPTKGGGLRTPSPWNPPQAVLPGGEKIPAAYVGTPAGFDRQGVPAGRTQIQKTNIRGLGPSRSGAAWEDRPGWRAERGELPLLSAVRRAEESLAFVRGQRRNLTVSVPEAAGGGEVGLTAEALDRAVERDARRYGGSVFY